MGWNSWDCYGAAVNEEQVRENARYMAKNLKTYGWEYIVVDIQWYEPNAVSHEYNRNADLVMDEFGRLMPAANRFPSAAGGSGFRPLADNIHSLGLKFGIHILRGIPRQAVRRNTVVKGTDCRAAEIVDFGDVCCWNGDMCGIDMSRRGAQAYYDSIFQLYAEWGVDYVKVDDIARPYHREEVEAIAGAIENSGREMVLSLSPGAAPMIFGMTGDCLKRCSITAEIGFLMWVLVTSLTVICFRWDVSECAIKRMEKRLVSRWRNKSCCFLCGQSSVRL